MINGKTDIHYNAMPIKEMEQMKINEIADDDCLLFMWVILLVVRQKVLANKFMQMAESMKDNGKRVKWMAKEKPAGKMVIAMKEIL